MHYLKAIKLILAIAALLFIAKPFIGFNTLNGLQHVHNRRLVLVKAFTKRKPEFLEDSEKEKASFQYRISNPPQKNTISIALLLSLLFPFAFLFKQIQKSPVCIILTDAEYGSKTYLFTGKLTI
ncbi:hypothetical protein [Mucilaginibacter lacusdianchii]|uniref:hypothetical protein n=1 Tax=Mucilaginibacter lacusdianchii TaxID=2684211 RepID=UPI00131B37BC|nr:hypothetical protein [Mucilaginibacter sp. JXJ CY 39]